MAQNEIVNVITVKTNNSKNTIKALKAEIAQLKKELDGATIGSDEFKKASNELSTAQKQLKDALAQTKQTAGAVDGSYDALVATMAQLKKEWRATADEVKRNNIGKQINDINTQLKELDSSIGNNQRKVGDYTGGIVDAFSQLKAEIKQYKSELLTLEEGTEEYNNTLAKLGDAQFQLKDINEKAALSVSDTGEVIKNVGKFAGGVVGGFNALQGVMALVGTEGEALNQTMVKLQAGISIVQGLQGIEGLADGFTGLKNSLGLANVSLKGFITKLGGLRGAIAKTGIGVLVIAIGALINKLLALKDEAEQRQIELAERARQREEEELQALEEYRKKIISNGEELIMGYIKLRAEYLSLKSDYQKTEWIDKNTEAFNALGLSVNNLAEAEDVLIKNTDNIVNAYVKRATIMAKQDELTQLTGKYIEQRIKDEEAYEKFKNSSASQKKAGDVVGTLNEQTVVGGYAKIATSGENKGKWVYTEEGIKHLEERVFQRSNSIREKMNTLAADLQEQMGDMIQTNTLADGSIAKLQDEINSLNTALNNAVVGSENFVRINNEIVAKEKELAEAMKQVKKYEQKTTTPTPKSSDDTSNLITQIELIKEKIKLQKMGEYDAELYELTKKFEEEKNLFIANGEDITQLTEYYEIAKQKIKKQFEEEALNNIENEFNTWKTTLLTNIDSMGVELGVDTSSEADNYETGDATAKQAYITAIVANQAKLLAEQEVYEQRKAFIEEQLNDETLNAQQIMLLEQQKAENEMFWQDAITQNAEKNAKAEELLEQRKLKIKQNIAKASSQLLQNLSNAVGENTAAGKAMAVSSALINTYESATGAYLSAVKPPAFGAASPAVGALFAAAALVQGFNQVKSILAVNPDGQTSMGNTSMPNVSVGSSMPVQYTRELMTDSELVTMNEQKEQKVIVVESDITETQKKVEVAETNSSF